MAVIFGLDAQHEEWFVYPEAGDEEYCLRPITDELIRDWNKKTTRKRWKQHQEIDERDEERYNALFVEHLFADWRGAIYLSIDDAKAGRTSACNLDNKIKFAGTQGDRFLWAVNSSRDMGNRLAQQIEGQRESFRESGEVSTRLSPVEL